MRPPAATPRPGGQRLPRGARVRRRGEYLRAYRRGRRRTGELVVLHFMPNDGAVPRVGVTISRKVGNSVVRHRVKRRILEAYRRASWRETLPPWDFVVHVKPAAAAADYAAVRQELDRLFGGVLRGAR